METALRIKGSFSICLGCFTRGRGAIPYRSVSIHVFVLSPFFCLSQWLYSPVILPKLTYKCNPGSADRSIRLWDHHKVIHTYTGHNDAVRGLALVPDVGFASCSNDRCALPSSRSFFSLYSYSRHLLVLLTFSRVPSLPFVIATL